MDDVTMARLLAKHALGLEDCTHQEPYVGAFCVIGDEVRIFKEIPEQVKGFLPQFRVWAPANVTDHAIEAAEAARDNCLVHGWAVRDTSTSVWRWEAKGSFTVRCHEEPRHAARLALATLRALGVEEEPTDAAD